jgi:hypothetical protein
VQSSETAVSSPLPDISQGKGQPVASIVDDIVQRASNYYGAQLRD